MDSPYHIFSCIAMSGTDISFRNHGLTVSYFQLYCNERHQPWTHVSYFLFFLRPKAVFLETQSLWDGWNLGYPFLFKSQKSTKKTTYYSVIPCSIRQLKITRAYMWQHHTTFSTERKHTQKLTLRIIHYIPYLYTGQLLFMLNKSTPLSHYRSQIFNREQRWIWLMQCINDDT